MRPHQNKFCAPQSNSNFRQWYEHNLHPHLGHLAVSRNVCLLLLFAAPGVQGVRAGDLGMLKENSQCTEQSVTTRNDLALAVSNVRVEISVVDYGD